MGYLLTLEVLETVGDMLDTDWLTTAKVLKLKSSDIKVIHTTWPDTGQSGGQAALAMLQQWYSKDNRGDEYKMFDLKKAMGQIKRTDILNYLDIGGEFVCFFFALPLPAPPLPFFTGRLFIKLWMEDFKCSAAWNLDKAHVHPGCNHATPPQTGITPTLDNTNIFSKGKIPNVFNNSSVSAIFDFPAKQLLKLPNFQTQLKASKTKAARASRVKLQAELAWTTEKYMTGNRCDGCVASADA
ncbi:hypothetical protein MAR_009718 [Mya arenaria]|uniref:Death domain-containing protein n=1 Tax=Mya arenaria TaxID=6604 RepID=A0ABY7E2J7_MYAAR|nr:hypothetical protein MAR_009718 [Mya arenaria]